MSHLCFIMIYNTAKSWIKAWYGPCIRVKRMTWLLCVSFITHFIRLSLQEWQNIFLDSSFGPIDIIKVVSFFIFCHVGDEVEGLAVPHSMSLSDPPVLFSTGSSSVGEGAEAEVLRNLYLCMVDCDPWGWCCWWAMTRCLPRFLTWPPGQAKAALRNEKLLRL